MFGSLTAEKEVKVPPNEAWEVYGTLELAKLVAEALPSIFAKIDVVQGHGAPGTILHIFFVPGATEGLTSYKEKYTVVDDEKRVKEAEVVEGGYLDLGFVVFRVRVEVIEKEGKEKECVTRATIEYEVKDEFGDNAALASIRPFVAIMQLVADYLHQKHNTIPLKKQKSTTPNDNEISEPMLSAVFYLRDFQVYVIIVISRVVSFICRSIS